MTNLKALIARYFPSWDRHRPTKMCPHRYCRAFHAISGLLGVPLMAYILFNGSLWFLLFLVLLSIIMTGVERGVWKRSRQDLLIEDRISQVGTGGGATVIKPDDDNAKPIKLGGKSGSLIVRRGWARAALACDGVILWAVASTVAHLASLDMTVPAGTDSDLLSLAVVVGFIAFSALAHRKATEPAKPLRIPVVVPGGEAS